MSDLRAVNPSADASIVTLLESLLAEARAGSIAGIAVIVALPSNRWRHVIVGESIYHNPADLNLRIDALKASLLATVLQSREER